MSYLHARRQIPGSSGSLFITMKPKAKYRFHAAAMLLFYIEQKYKLHIFQRSVTLYHFRTLYY
jgi:hypothetical protein